MIPLNRLKSVIMIALVSLVSTALPAVAEETPLNAATPETAPTYDIIIGNGTIYDGSGEAPYSGDIAILEDRIAAIGDLGNASARQRIDANGMAVSPGFVNLISWANESIVADGRAASDVMQGITLEVMGEGRSNGPMNEKMKADYIADFQQDYPHGPDVAGWKTLNDYFVYIEKQGISPNVASFLGAATVRIHELGHEDRPPTAEELLRMQALVDQGMREGALGVGSALIYAPGFYASTDELVALAEVAAKYDGVYSSHLRSMADTLNEGIDEFVKIIERSGASGEIYHLMAAGERNWHKLDLAITQIEAAQASGLDIKSDMHPYTHGGTGITVAMPPWVLDGGVEALMERLRDPGTRNKIRKDMETESLEWENAYLGIGPERIFLQRFSNPELSSLVGKSLAEVAAMRRVSGPDAAMDLILENGAPMSVLLQAFSEDNIRKKVQVPWLSFCTDSPAPAAEGRDLETMVHPRAYGAYPKVLGQLVREEGLVSLQEAIRRMTSMPTEHLNIRERGRLQTGYFADIVVFDPDTIIDNSTYEKPHQYPTGIHHVFVNGGQVVRDGVHTNLRPGRAVRGPGWTGWQKNRG